jgi:hypothetical protein
LRSKVAIVSPFVSEAIELASIENYAGEDAPGLLFYRPQRRAELYPGSKSAAA